MFYLKSLAVMFVLAVPITAILAGVFGVIVPEDPNANKTITMLVSENLQALYLLAWPVVGLLSVAHTVTVHATPINWGLKRRWNRIMVAAAAGLLFGIAIGAVGDFGTRALVTVVVDYALLGAVYGVFSTLLVPLSTGRGARSEISSTA